MSIRGFRTKIAFNVVFLLFFSAIITDVLLVVIIQGVMVRDHLSHQTRLIESFGQIAIQQSLPSESDALHHHQQQQDPFVLYLPVDSEWSDIYVTDPYGALKYKKISGKFTAEQLAGSAKAAARAGKVQREFFDISWAVYWWHPSGVLVSVPIWNDGMFRGSAVAAVPLVPIYDKIRQYNRPIYIYIFFNTLLLGSVGLYRIFRIYLRPIDRIIHQADDYRENEDLLFTFRQEDNELNRLSKALNRMLERISEDKGKLTETVSRLEKTNQELRRAQNEIIRAEKMASVGRLAAGIAHEIGNPIGIVLGYLDLLKQPDLDRAEQDDYTQRAEVEIQRINRVIRQLLDLARSKQSSNETACVHAVIEDIVDVMAHQPMMVDIRLEKRFEAPKDNIRGDTDQLRQVFLNLLLNAADAIHTAEKGDQGAVTISTTTHLDNDKNWLIVDFQDNGEGIEADQLDTIFDPFYTTKEPGKGTGLGLAVSFMIIEKMGGSISVKSSIGEGTTFTIRLPLIVESAEASLPSDGR